MGTKPPNLFDHGIQTEDSDIRAHVSPYARAIYVFKTPDMVAFINDHKDMLRYAAAYQPGVDGPTGWGALVPIMMCDFLRVVPMRAYDWSEFPADKGMSTSAKGAAAVNTVLAAMKTGYFPFWVDAEESDDAEIQLSGTDVLVKFGKRIQVKCDYRAAPKEIVGGSGNLYIQTAERNPLKHI